jgi:hypothetical protein
MGCETVDCANGGGEGLCDGMAAGADERMGSARRWSGVATRLNITYPQKRKTLVAVSPLRLSKTLVCGDIMANLSQSRQIQSRRFGDCCKIIEVVAEMLE